MELFCANSETAISCAVWTCLVQAVENS